MTSSSGEAFQPHQTSAMREPIKRQSEFLGQVRAFGNANRRALPTSFSPLSLSLSLSLH
jgi:hypothetical protein